MQDFSLHILDLMENSFEAGAKTIRVYINENINDDLLEIILEDDGRGMSQDLCQRVLDPFYTTKKVRRVGLGLPLFADRARETEGTISIDSRLGKGTKINGTFSWSHWDRPPLGDLLTTIIVFIQGHPDLDVIYQHTVNEKSIEFNTIKYREILKDIPFDSQEVLEYFHEELIEKLATIRVLDSY